MSKNRATLPGLELLDEARASRVNGGRTVHVQYWWHNYTNAAGQRVHTWRRVRTVTP